MADDLTMAKSRERKPERSACASFTPGSALSGSDSSRLKKFMG